MEYRAYQPSDLYDLLKFLNGLPPSIRKRFAPHAFDENTLRQLLHGPTEYKAFLALDGNKIISYQILKKGWLDYEWPRNQYYPVEWQYEKCATYAPVVSAEYQSKGIGRSLFNTLLDALQNWNTEKIILWGGVQ